MSEQWKGFEWGNSVWVKTERSGRQPGIVLAWDADAGEYLVSWKATEDKPHVVGIRPIRLSPRDDEPRPGKWRLPEVGDTIRITGKSVHEDYKTQDYKIAATVWSNDNPIGFDFDGDRIWLNPDDIEPVRLHDDPEVRESEKTAPVEPQDPMPRFSEGQKVWVARAIDDLSNRLYGQSAKAIRIHQHGARYLYTLEFQNEKAVLLESLLEPEESKPTTTPEPPVVVADPKADTMHDPVHHPSHYRRGGIEVIDFLEAFMTPDQFEGYLLGTQLAYNSRANWKGSLDEDFRKAEWYQKRLVAFREKRKGA